MPHSGASQFIQKLAGVACVAGRILLPAVIFWWQSHHARQAEKLQEIFVSSFAVRPATFLMSFECRALLSPCLEPFVPNHEQLCNTKLTCKRAWPRVTVESRRKQLFVESYTQDPRRICCSYSVWSWDLLGVTWPLSYCSVCPNHVLVDSLCSLKVFKLFSRSITLHQTWETKFFIKPSFSSDKKLYTSKEVKEIPKMLYRSNSVRDKNHSKSMLECTGNTSASCSLNQQRYHLLSQKQESSTAYSTRISNVHVLNDQALFLCWAWMDQGSLHCLIRFCYIAKKR